MSIFSSELKRLKNTTLRYLFFCVLLTLLVGNYFLFDWFATRARQASADEIVQKAYIVSRLLSEAAARPIIKRDLSRLEGAVDEALKDRHLVSVKVRDKSGKILLENSAANPPPRLSTFETPINLDEKKIGTLTTSFSLGSQDEMLTASLRRTVVIQAGLFVFIVLLLAIFFFWDTLARRAFTGKALVQPGVEEVAGTAEIVPANHRELLLLPLARMPLLPPSYEHSAEERETESFAVAGSVQDNGCSLRLPAFTAMELVHEPRERLGLPLKHGNEAVPAVTGADDKFLLVYWDEAGAADEPVTDPVLALTVLPDPATIPLPTIPVHLAELQKLGFPGANVRPAVLSALLQSALTAVPRQGSDVPEAAVLDPVQQLFLPRMPLLLSWHSLLTMSDEAAGSVAQAVLDTSCPVTQIPELTLSVVATELLEPEQTQLLSANVYGASTALQKALAVLSAESDRRYTAAGQAMACHARINELQQQAIHRAGHADLLIVTGSDIIATVTGQFQSLAGTESSHLNGLRLFERQLHDAVPQLQGAMEVVERIETSLQQAGVQNVLPRDSSIVAAAEIAQVGVVAMRGGALPAITATIGSEEIVAGQAASLLRLMEELDGTSDRFARNSAELSRMSLSLSRSTSFFADPADWQDAEGWIGLMSERMCDLAERLERDTRSLQAMISQAAAVGKAVTGEASKAKDNMVQARVAVEEAVAASVLSDELLQRAIQERARDRDVTARELAHMVPQLREVRRPLAEHLEIIGQMAEDVTVLTGVATEHQLEAQDYASSLAVASEPLRLARVFLSESIADTVHLADASREKSPLHGATKLVAANRTLEHLICEARERLALIIADADR